MSFQTAEDGGKCPHFEDGRACRGCEYADNPKLFDPCCLYGHLELSEDMPRREAEMQERCSRLVHLSGMIYQQKEIIRTAKAKIKILQSEFNRLASFSDFKTKQDNGG